MPHVISLFVTLGQVPVDSGTDESRLDAFLWYVQGILDDFAAWAGKGYNTPLLLAMIVVGTLVLRPDLLRTLWNRLRGHRSDGSA